MNRFPELNLPVCQFRLRHASEGDRIWDALRRQWLVLTSEEWVRQHFIRYLIERKGVPPASISQEYPVSVGGMPQRADIVVSDKAARPCLLVECKAPEVAVDRTVFAQAVRYNSVIDAPYIAMSNGMRHCCFEKKEGGGYVQLRAFPDFSAFFGV